MVMVLVQLLEGGEPWRSGLPIELIVDALGEKVVLDWRDGVVALELSEDLFGRSRAADGEVGEPELLEAEAGPLKSGGESAPERFLVWLGHRTPRRRITSMATSRSFRLDACEARTSILNASSTPM